MMFHIKGGLFNGGRGQKSLREGWGVDTMEGTMYMFLLQALSC